MTKYYRFYGIDTAIDLLRPGARWEMFDGKFSIWDDPRPQPTLEEIAKVLDLIKQFEDSVDTIWLPEDEEKLKKHHEIMNKGFGG